MKVLAINCSPRKNWNTAKLLKSALEGAKSTGAEVEYMDLYDYVFTGCRACMLCKRTEVQRCLCYWNDDLSMIIEKVFSSDVLIIGTPIYLGRPTSEYFALMERLHFSALSYDDYSSYFKGNIDVELILTMNATEDFYEKLYKRPFEAYAEEFRFLNGNIHVTPCFNTLQVHDYSKFNMASFSEEAKKKHHDEHFSLDLKKAYERGVLLSS